MRGSEKIMAAQYSTPGLPWVKISQLNAVKILPHRQSYAQLLPKGHTKEYS